MHGSILLLLTGLVIVSAFTVRDPLQIEEDNSVQVPRPKMLEIIVGEPTETRTLKRCWVTVMFVHICTFVVPEGEQNVQEDGGEALGESESCDKLGCQLFCKKNHFKRSVCHKKGCECDF